MKKRIIEIAVAGVVAIVSLATMPDVIAQDREQNIHRFQMDLAQVEEITNIPVETLPIETESVTEQGTESVTIIETYYAIPLDEELQDGIKEICNRYELAYELVLAVAFVESSFKAGAIGDGGDAIGLMQIQPKWWQGLINETGLNINEPLGNVEVAVMIINQFLQDNNGDMRCALNQYNSGRINDTTSPYFDRVLDALDYLGTLRYTKEVEQNERYY